MLNRFSSRKTDLGKQYLADRLQDAVSYDRIAGYFCSSVLEIAGEAMEKIPGKIRIICNSIPYMFNTNPNIRMCSNVYQIGTVLFQQRTRCKQKEMLTCRFIN